MGLKRSGKTGKMENTGGENMRKTHTSTEVKQRWIDANYQRYSVSFRYDSDREIIEYIKKEKEAGRQTTDIFREALELLIESEK